MNPRYDDLRLYRRLRSALPTGSATEDWSGMTGVVRVSVGEVSLTTSADPLTDADIVRAEMDPDLVVTGFRFGRSERASVGLDPTEAAGTAYPHTEGWYPQGITGSADAVASGTIGGRKYLVVSWHSKYPGAARLTDAATADQAGRLPYTRITLIDVTDMTDVRYRHVLLVEPDPDGNEDFTALMRVDEDGDAEAEHAGGCVWIDKWLYVAGESLLVFDMEDLTDVKRTNEALFGWEEGSRESERYRESTTVGIVDGVWHAYGYRYVLPVSRRYDWSVVDSTLFAEGKGSPFATIGLDRSTDPPRLVSASYVHEWDATYDQDPDDRIVAFWALHPDTLLPVVGTVDELFDSQEYMVQGVNASDGTVWMSRSGPTEDEKEFARLTVRVIGSKRSTSYDWPRAAESLTYAPRSDHLWCVTENHTDLLCFCVNRDTVHGPLG